MTLKYQLDSLDGVDESIAKFYTESDGKHVLNVEGAVPKSQFEEVQSKYLSTKDEVIQKRLSAKEWKELGESPAAVRELLKNAGGSGKAAEEAQAKLDAMEAKYSGELTAAQERVTKMMQRTATSDLKAELAKAGFISEAIDDIAITAMSRLQFNDDGTPKVLTSDGKPMIGNGADHGATLADLAKELAEAKPYAVRDSGKGGGGKPAGSQGGTPINTIKRSDYDALSPPERSKFLKGGGKLTD